MLRRLFSDLLWDSTRHSAAGRNHRERSGSNDVSLTTNEGDVPYHRLVLAPGSVANLPSIVPRARRHADSIFMRARS